MVVSVEYPQGSQDPVYIDPNRVMIVWDVDAGTPAYRLRFRDVKPSSSQTYTLAYQGLHTTSGAAVTIAAGDIHAFADLAAAYAFRQLAAKAAQSRDSTLDADSVDYGGQVARYTALADRLLRQYRDHVGVGKEGEGSGDAPAAVWLDTDTRSTWTTERLFHPSGLT